MATVPQKELRNQVGDVLRRVEAGEELTVTVAGRPAATLSPVRRRQWVGAAEARSIWAGEPPRTLARGRGEFPAALADPFDA